MSRIISSRDEKAKQENLTARQFLKKWATGRETIVPAIDMVEFAEAYAAHREEELKDDAVHVRNTQDAVIDMKNALIHRAAQLLSTVINNEDFDWNERCEQWLKDAGVEK